MASDFFKYFYDQRGGVAVFLVCLVCFVLLLQRIAWIFEWGRFKKPAVGTASPTIGTGDGTKTQDSKIAFVVANFFVKLINDFRHLLALVLVMVFAGVLCYALYKVDSSDKNSLTKALQAVMSTMGGLIGSIVGYYFGESAGRKSENNATPNQTPVIRSEPQQAPPTDDGDASVSLGSPGPIQRAPMPKGSSSSSSSSSS